MECKREDNLKSCKCTYPGCPRKGHCCECVRYHIDNDELPGCFFSSKKEKTYNRSISNL